MFYYESLHLQFVNVSILVELNKLEDMKKIFVFPKPEKTHLQYSYLRI
jgi:hypothetical protein